MKDIFEITDKLVDYLKSVYGYEITSKYDLAIWLESFITGNEPTHICPVGLPGATGK